MSPVERKDLVVLVPCKDCEETIRALLSERCPALGIRELTFDIYPQSLHDPSVYRNGHAFLRQFTGQYHHALAVFDREGSGAADSLSREEIEAEVQARLTKNGWDDRAEVIVFDPLLDTWVWSDSPHVDRCLGWKNRCPPLREWLTEQGLWPQGTRKPLRSKEAVIAAMKKVKKSRSSAIYSQLARTVSLQRCQDAAFLKFKSVLRKWFPIE